MAAEKTPQSADEWLDTLHLLFAQESDRAAAIVAAAIVEDAIETLLRKRLVEPYLRERDLLREHSGPLGSFSAKIDACFQLGLISRYMAQDLHLIRKIRNEFAHAASLCTFDTEPVHTWVRTLEAKSDYNQRYPDTRKSIGPPDRRSDFLGMASWLLYSICRSHEDIQPLPEKHREFGYIDYSLLPSDVQGFLAQFGQG